MNLRDTYKHSRSSFLLGSCPVIFVDCDYILLLSFTSVNIYLLSLSTFYFLHKRVVLSLTTFYKNYVVLCAAAHKSLSHVAEAIGLSRTSPNGWKKGKQPSEVTLAKLSQYFNVPVSFLLDEHLQVGQLQLDHVVPEIKKEPATLPGDKLSQEIIEKLAALTPENRTIALAQLDFLLSRQEDQET